MSESVMVKTSQEYFRNRRVHIAGYLKKGHHHVLDVGCGAGNFGYYLKQQGHASKVDGIEIDKNAANESMSKLDKVFCADLNSTPVKEVLSSIDNNLYDYIVCADVLEHLVDPWQVLQELLNYLSPNGKVIVSIPNVRHWSVWLPLLLNGKWDYQDAGIMDRTHLRFFTRSTIRELFDAAGLDVVEIQPLIGGKWKLIDKYSLQLLRDFVAVQWVFVGVPNDSI